MKIEFDKNKRIGVGVSGGADSMVLLDLLMKAGANVLAVNIEHGIRGEASLADTAFVKEHCRKQGIPCKSFSLDVPACAKEKGISTETAARLLRYDVFDKLIKNGTVDVIALAHHADDQAETMLMRLFRGTGVRGLRGIVDRDGYIHPLLAYTKAEILDYASENGIEYRTDESNLDSDYNRNFIRNKLVPLIKERYPAFVESALRTAEAMGETEDYLLSEVTPYAEVSGACVLPLSAFNRHPAIAKKSVAECLRRGLGLVKDVEARHLAAVSELAKSAVGTTIDLPFGVVATKEDGGIAFYKPQEKDMNEHPVEVNKNYVFGSVGYQISHTNALVPHVTFDIDKLPSGAVIRMRREGDLFKRFGGGTKPLAEYLTDIKYPLRLRDSLPVIAKGSTVYVVMGIEIGEAVKVDNATHNMVQIISNKI